MVMAARPAISCVLDHIDVLGDDVHIFVHRHHRWQNGDRVDLLKTGTYGAQVCQELLGGNLGLYCTQVAQFVISHLIDGRKYEGLTSGVSNHIQVTIVDLCRSFYLQPSARGTGGAGRYHIFVNV